MRTYRGWDRGLALCVAAALCAASAAAATPAAPAKETAASPPTGSQDIQVADGDDDAEEASDGDVMASSSDLELAYDDEHGSHGSQTVGIRFAGLKAPRGALVRNAFIQFTCKDSSDEPCRLTIRGQAAPNAAAFKEKRRDVSSRPTTRAEVRWEPPAWHEGAAGAAQRTGDLAAIVQEIIGSEGWAPGNSLVFIVTGQGRALRRAWSCDGQGSQAPRLHVEWGQGGSASPPAAQPGQDAAASASLPSVRGQETRVARDEDDAEERAGGSVSLSSSDIELVFDEARDEGSQTVGVRFTGISVPARATVARAWVQFTACESSRGACQLVVRGEAAGSAAPFEEERRNVSARPRTKAEVRWEPPPWKADAAEAAQRTPDLAPIVREIVARPDWSPGNPLAFIITGEGTRRAYSHDSSPERAARLHVEWQLGPVAQPPSAVGAQAGAPVPHTASQPGAPPEPAGEPGRSLSEAANELIDDLLATGSRLIELPLVMVLVGVAAGVGGLAVVARYTFCRQGKRRWVYRGLLGGFALLVVLAAAFSVDRRIARVQDQVRQLGTRMVFDAPAPPPGAAQPGAPSGAARRPYAPRKASLVEAAAAQEAMEKQFGKVKMQVSPYDDAMDLVRLRLVETVAEVLLVVVDLEHPGLEVRVDPAITRKWLTSEFARENSCTVAINGTTGRSSSRNSGLGEWRGFQVCRGQVVSEEEKDTPRPCLAFDQQNRATYLPMAAAERKLPPGTYNAISGHFDALLAGVEPKKDETRHPYTAMGINEKGTVLYLLVVDGRQPRQSMGLSRRDIARVLKGFGAHNAMLCDGGGSTCVYLKKLGGIANQPSDGEERPTYTHFGLALPGGE